MGVPDGRFAGAVPILDRSAADGFPVGGFLRSMGDARDAGLERLRRATN